jgi:hypothetical protein
LSKKQIVGDCLAGANGRANVEGWLPGFVEYPLRLYVDGSCTIVGSESPEIGRRPEF